MADQFIRRKGILPFLSAVAGAALIGLGAIAAPAGTPAARPVAAVSFPHERSDLKADPEQIYGRLPNGLTYVIQKNQVPRGAAAIYMRVAVGSLMESEKQRGLAHFVEHMAFAGTSHIPAGELKKTLERHGFAFGADANAFTSEQQTTYQLNAPKADDDSLDTGLFILREIAGEMSLAPDAVERERGVILSEERARDKPALHYAVKLNSWMYAGQRFATGWNPIGSVAVLRTATRADLAAFYDSWYRPELTTLVVVGDVDPAQVEARIKAKFSDWSGRGPAPTEPDWGHHAPAGLRAFAHAEKGLTEEVQARWTNPPDDSPDSLQKKRDDLRDLFLIDVINRRYTERVANPDTAYVAASVQRSSHFRTDRAIFLTVTPKPGRAREAFAQAFAMFQTFRAYGVTPTEVTTIGDLLATRRTALSNNRKSRTNSDLAKNILARIGGNSVFISLADELTLNDALKAEVSQAGLNARLKTLFDGDGPTLIHSGEMLGDFGPEVMEADYIALRDKTPATYAEAARKAWPYTDFGPAAAPPVRTVDKAFGFSRYVFANGVVLNIKASKGTNKVAIVEVAFAGGRKRFDPAAGRPMALAQGALFVFGGLGQVTYDDMRALLRARTYSIEYTLSDSATLLRGKTNAVDLPVQMQVLMAYATDPGLRADRFTPYKAMVPEILSTQQTDPVKVLGYNLPAALMPGDSRLDPRIRENIGQIPYTDISSLFAESLRDTPIVISMVGDVDEAQAVAEVAKTFGTLPPRPVTAPVFAGSERTSFPPKEREFTFFHQGRDDQSLSEIIWPTTDFYTSGRDSAGLDMLAAIVRNRLFEELRQKQGADYSPQARSFQADSYPGFGYVEVQVRVKAGADADFRTTLAAVVADLRAKPISDDELLRVAKPAAEKLALRKQNIDYWVSMMRNVELDPRARAAWLSQSANLQAVTAADILRLAQTYLKDDTAIHIKVVPVKPVP